MVVVPQSNGLLGALMTFGEHKGYGLAVACELLGGALSGGGTWRRRRHDARAVIDGMLTILIDPQRLGTQTASTRRHCAFVRDWLRSGPVADGSDGVRLAGDCERAARARRERVEGMRRRPADLAGARQQPARRSMSGSPG